MQMKLRSENRSVDIVILDRICCIYFITPEFTVHAILVRHTKRFSAL